jgi:amino acid permease
MLMQRVKPLSRILAQGADQEHGLKRSLGPWALTAMGIGAIIGTGIFVLTGVASATRAGPSLTFSFVVAGIVSALAALCYAEVSSKIPDLRQRLHLHLCDARRVPGLDRRLGTGPRICARSRDRQRRMVRLF